MTAPAQPVDGAGLVRRLQAIVGRPFVLTDPANTALYRTGFRFGSGSCLAVVRPASLVELWRVLQACVETDAVVIMQAANTGLTGGSTPSGDDYDRPVVVVNTMRVRGVQVLQDEGQVVCLAGATLYDLERELKPYGREPHSVIGSSCFGASVVGGVCNNSGGSLIRRGPAYTEMALYAQIAADGRLELVNHLGIRLGDDPETVLSRLERADYGPGDMTGEPRGRCSDDCYIQHVRDIDAATPARFNADPQRLFEASGSAGKLAVFAVRLDTFEPVADAQVFYVGTNDPGQLSTLRRGLMRECLSLPIAAEYMDRSAFDMAAEYGKDMYVVIRRLGTDRLPALFRLKGWLDRFARASRVLPDGFSDRLMQWVGRCLPEQLPKTLWDYRNRFGHYLMLKVGGEEAELTREILTRTFATGDGDFFACSREEAAAAFLHRFVAAGAAIRYRTVHARQVEDIVALDVALPRNTEAWVETLPPEIEASILKRIYYGHFFCHVFHQDYIVRKGCDPIALEHAMWEVLDQRGAEYPAEHNVGHLYPAKPALADFYRGLDPRNQMNPGVGQTSKQRFWAQPTS